MISKLKKFLGYPTRKKVEVINGRLVILLFVKVRAFLLLDRVTISYMPDSISQANAYPHIKSLYESFRKFNKLNNGGDIARLISIVLNVEKVVGEDNVGGEFAEVGVYKGNTAAILAHYAKKYNRKCYLFDTFEGFSEKDLVGTDANFSKGHFSDTSVNVVKDVIGTELIDSCEFIKGYFPESIPPTLASTQFAVVSLDADLYQPMKAGLDWFYPKMGDGAIFLLHDYSSRYWDGCKRAIDEFCSEKTRELS